MIRVAQASLSRPMRSGADLMTLGPAEVPTVADARAVRAETPEDAFAGTGVDCPIEELGTRIADMRQIADTLAEEI